MGDRCSAVGKKLESVSDKIIKTFYRMPMADCRKPNNVIVFYTVI